MSPVQKPTYSSYTYDSPNAVKRAIHRRRYANVLRHLGITPRSRVLDYGCGDGRLFRIMLDKGMADPGRLVAFDPVPDMQAQFARLVPEVRIFAESAHIPDPAPGTGFDFIFCCEVLEHLSPEHTEATFREFQRLGGPATVFVVEVPIEIGFFGAMKNVYRKVFAGVRIPWRVIARAMLGAGTARSPRVTSSGQTTFDHPGYSFKTTRQQLIAFMDIVDEFNDPFRKAPYVVNNSHIFVARLKPSRPPL